MCAVVVSVKCNTNAMQPTKLTKLLPGLLLQLITSCSLLQQLFLQGECTCMFTIMSTIVQQSRKPIIYLHKRHCQSVGATNKPPQVGERRLWPPLYQCLAKPGKVGPWQVYRLLAPASDRNFPSAIMGTCLEQRATTRRWSNHHSPTIMNPN